MELAKTKKSAICLSATVAIGLAVTSIFNRDDRFRNGDERRNRNDRRRSRR